MESTEDLERSIRAAIRRDSASPTELRETVGAIPLRASERQYTFTSDHFSEETRKLLSKTERRLHGDEEGELYKCRVANSRTIDSQALSWSDVSECARRVPDPELIRSPASRRQMRDSAKVASSTSRRRATVQTPLGVPEAPSTLTSARFASAAAPRIEKSGDPGREERDIAFLALRGDGREGGSGPLPPRERGSFQEFLSPSADRPESVDSVDADEAARRWRDGENSHCLRVFSRARRHGWITGRVVVDEAPPGGWPQVRGARLSHSVGHVGRPESAPAQPAHPFSQHIAGSDGDTPSQTVRRRGEEAGAEGGGAGSVGHSEETAAAAAAAPAATEGQWASSYRRRSPASARVSAPQGATPQPHATPAGADSSPGTAGTPPSAGSDTHRRVGYAAQYLGQRADAHSEHSPAAAAAAGSRQRRPASAQRTPPLSAGAARGGSSGGSRVRRLSGGGSRGPASGGKGSPLSRAVVVEVPSRARHPAKAARGGGPEAAQSGGERVREVVSRGAFSLGPHRPAVTTAHRVPAGAQGPHSRRPREGDGRPSPPARAALQEWRRGLDGPMAPHQTAPRLLRPTESSYARTAETRAMVGLRKIAQTLEQTRTALEEATRNSAQREPLAWVPEHVRARAASQRASGASHSGTQAGPTRSEAVKALADSARSVGVDVGVVNRARPEPRVRHWSSVGSGAAAEDAVGREERAPVAVRRSARFEEPSTPLFLAT